jgi:hypothetical protein
MPKFPRLSFPWSRTVPREDPAVRQHREAVAADLHDVSAPSAVALARLRGYHPPLVEAEKALVKAEARQRQAVDEAADLERQAGSICQGVATGRTTREAAERALVASKGAALGLDGHAAAVAEARGRVATETAAAIRAAAENIRARRQAIEKRVAPLRPQLEAAARELAVIAEEVYALQTARGAYLLTGLDGGPNVDWPLSPTANASLQGWLNARPLRRPRGDAA